MNIEELEATEGYRRFSLNGELVNSDELNFLDEVLSSGSSAELDLSGVTYINSSGFGAMVEETMNYNEAGLTLTFIGLSSVIRKTIGILGAEELLNFLD